MVASAEPPAQPWSWERLQENVNPLILAAPQISWEQVDYRMVRYLLQEVKGTPWLNMLALLTGALTSYAQLDLSTIRQYVQTIHVRWKTLFAAYNLTSVDQWNPAQHFARYMRDTTSPDTLNTRQTFLRNYGAAATYAQGYLRSLQEEAQILYRAWILPALPPEVVRQLSRENELAELQHQQRKLETDALAPFFAQLRAEAHLRWNELHRLRLKYREAMALVEAGQARTPFSFSYEEPRRKQRLHFVLWEEPRFLQAYSDDHPTEKMDLSRAWPHHYLLEFLRAEPTDHPASPDEPQDLLWFGELLRYGLLSSTLFRPNTAEGQRKLDYLRSWGYDPAEDERMDSPFRTRMSGLLSWPPGESFFPSLAQQWNRGLLIPVEPLFAGATFGLAALDLFTTTGARMNELLQVSLTPECLHTLVVGGTRRLILRLVPKGEQTLAEYFVGPETQRNLEKVATFLREYYQLKEGEPIPTVDFDSHHSRSHRFPPRPYLFQYHGRQLYSVAITACLRFLCHGMVFQTVEGQIVVLKAHALRHVFATHLHQVEKVPLDIVALLLHQKNLQVTGYYAAPTHQQLVETTDSLLDRFATHLGSLEDALIRAPEELRQQLEAAQQQVGTLTRVPGGVCTCHAICPIAFACTGCVYKVPDPERRQDIVEQKRWAAVWLKRSEARQLGPEIVKMRALIQRCDTELEEMHLIEAYQKDEQHEPPLQIEPEA